jgi:hypothetical protein
VKGRASMLENVVFKLSELRKCHSWEFHFFAWSLVNIRTPEMLMEERRRKEQKNHQPWSKEKRVQDGKMSSTSLVSKEAVYLTW